MKISGLIHLTSFAKPGTFESFEKRSFSEVFRVFALFLVFFHFSVSDGVGNPHSKVQTSQAAQVKG